MAGRLGPGIDYLPSGRYRARVHVGGGRYRSKSFTRSARGEGLEVGYGARTRNRTR